MLRLRIINVLAVNRQLCVQRTKGYFYTDNNRCFSSSKRHYQCVRFYPTDSRTRGYSPLRASHSSDAPTFIKRDNQETAFGRRETATITTHVIRKYVLLSNHITQCQTFLLLSHIIHRFQYEQKSVKYSSKTNLINLKKQPNWKKLIFQLRKNNFPVGK